MTNTLQQHVSKIRLGAASAALTLVVVLVFGVVATPWAQAQTFKTLHSFDVTDGQYPEAGLVQGTNGDFYGTTYFGGTGTACFSGCGTVFKITPSGALTTLHSFDITDGSWIIAGLVQGTNGDFYGTTFEGGASDNCFDGCGTIFKITPSGTLTTLHSFNFYTDGASPEAGLVQGTNGDFYGATEEGGANGYGTVFKITPSGTLTTLHSFDVTDGANPLAGLVQATNGRFYGTTGGGGTSTACFSGCGTVFKITPSGALTTLHSFDNTDGANPYAALVQATNGDFYGTTYFGGTGTACFSGCGTVFKITPSGALTTLHSFDNTDGANPYAALVQATNGDFYGTTGEGGANGYGTVFKITPSGTLTTLHTFAGYPTDGGTPVAGLVQATNGKFYGTTFQGGANGDGTVFSVSVGLGPFVETQPTSDKVGAVVKILGTDLIGTTSVTFNGTAATFAVVSSSEIKTAVPTGATTGTVKVTTPKGTLKSNVVFRVTN